MHLAFLVNTSHDLADVIQEHLGILLAIVDLTFPPPEAMQPTTAGRSSLPLTIGLVVCGVVALVVVSVLIVVGVLIYCRYSKLSNCFSETVLLFVGRA